MAQNLNFFQINRALISIIIHIMESIYSPAIQLGIRIAELNRCAILWKKIPNTEITEFFTLSSTIGAFIIFPARKINNMMTINGARGLNLKIKDRFDLSLECIRLYYDDIDSPLFCTLQRYSNFFRMFGNFKNYVEFFLLQDLLDSKKNGINFFLPFDNFERDPLPIDEEEYLIYKNNVMQFISSRNERIENYSSGINENI